MLPVKKRKDLGPHENPLVLKKYTHTHIFSFPASMPMFWVVSWCCGLREGWGWVSVSTVSSSVCHPEGLACTGVPVTAACKLLLSYPALVVARPLHNNSVIITWQSVNITWIITHNNLTPTISTCPPCQTLQGDCPGPVAQAPWFISFFLLR